jgi:uncharacterized SAM-binding protein YcdF (DUF218 family)
MIDHVPAVSFRPRHKLRLVLASSALVVGAFGVFAFFQVGRFLASEQPLQRADAIFVFAGTVVERPLEAADLYRGGYAPIIVVTRATAEQGTFQLERRGVRIPTAHDLTKEVLLQVGVPAAALMTPTFVHDNTGEEARTLRELALQHRWHRVILVSSKYHLRRLAVAARRQLRGTNVEVIARGSRYDPATPDRWWTRRRDVRSVAAEVPKLIAYALGVGV